jgi:hypothetical protein
VVVMLWEKRWEVKGRREGAGNRGLFSWLVEGSFGVRGLARSRQQMGNDDEQQIIAVSRPVGAQLRPRCSLERPEGEGNLQLPWTWPFRALPVLQDKL